MYLTTKQTPHRRESMGTHGMRKTKIYKTWVNMKARCYYEKDKRYKDYGLRGIAVCEEWKNDFMAFYNHVSQLENYGVDGYTLDRIDNNGNYEPGNVKWSTIYEQIHNRRPLKKWGKKWRGKKRLSTIEREQKENGGKRI